MFEDGERELCCRPADALQCEEPDEGGERGVVEPPSCEEASGEAEALVSC